MSTKTVNMWNKRPFGVTLLSAFLTISGGLASLFIIFEIIDSLQIFGPQSIYISNPVAFIGFLLYGGTPIVFYVTGVGLWLLKPWARHSALLILPVLMFFFTFNWAANIAREETAMYGALAIDLLTWRFGIFANAFSKYLVGLIALIFYFNRPKVIDAFYQ